MLNKLVLKLKLAGITKYLQKLHRVWIHSFAKPISAVQQVFLLS
jgi:hypothetical protein